MGHSLIKAEDVCAFFWTHADRLQRANACVIAGVTLDRTVDWDWCELDTDEREKLVAAFVDQIETEIPQVSIKEKA